MLLSNHIDRIEVKVVFRHEKQVEFIYCGPSWPVPLFPDIDFPVKDETGAIVGGVVNQHVAMCTTEMSCSAEDDDLVRRDLAPNIAIESKCGAFVLALNEGDLAHELQTFLVVLVRDTAPASLATQERGISTQTLSHFIVKDKRGPPLKGCGVGREVCHLHSCGRVIWVG